MTKPAIVIGSGLGGLAAAIRLRARGYGVVVLEAGAQPGGRARVFHQDGFTFDAGPTVVTAPYLFEELFSAVGRDMRDYFELTPIDPFYRVSFPDGEQFDYVGDEQRLLAQIEQLSPRDVDGYLRMAAHAKRIFEVGYLRLADAPFDQLGSMLRIVPDLVRLRCYRSVHALVSSYIKDERLRQVFTFEPLLIGGHPYRVPGIYLLIHWLERKWGVHFAKGGTTSIVHGMARLLDELGVDIRYNSAVSRIDVQHGVAKAVELENGQRIEAELVVSNADPAMVYTKMIAPEHRPGHSDRSIAKKHYSMSLFVSYFGTKRTYPDLAHHTIILGKRYRELLDDVFDRKQLADDFSLYLHAPTRTDPTLAPPGHECFYVLSPVPNQQSGIDWQRTAADYQEKIFSALEQTHLPGLRDNLVTSFQIDPRYFEGPLRSYHGAAFGPEPLLRQSAYFRFHNRDRDIAGLYFVGAGTHPGAGMPGVLCSAKVLDRLVPAPAHRLDLPATFRHPAGLAATGLAATGLAAE